MIKFFADSDSDITIESAKEYDITLISMPYIVNDQIIYPYVDFTEFNEKEFYDQLRGGLIPKTCALNPEEYRKYFEPCFKAGDDILYVHFSREMSGTFNSLNVAVSELQEEYPDRKVYLIDTKSISVGAYPIIKEVGDMLKKNTPIEEIMKWAETEIYHFACYFYADNLTFFRHSGRVSGIAGIMGNILSIKPIIYMNDEGYMVNIGKEHGRQKALNRILNYVIELQDDIKNHLVTIGHADSPALALELGNMLKEKFGDDLNIEYIKVNPTAGSHCGPDTVGISFHATHR